MSARPSDNGALIEISDVRKIYEMGSTEVNALDGVSLHVRKGEYLGIKANRQSLYSCRREDPVFAQQLMFQPVLPVGGPFEPRDSWSDCTLARLAVKLKWMRK